ncbi:AglZ/HisF2 family acetamidino modification protein [Pseudomonas fluorescens]|uniref:AglZ/HisF2 family acetamidino modification protein n=1 Tax=Pseudomonas fluorescens TaxID=294 RepID=UPI0021C9A972|nr:AglZ/HisF2 family acetamidino modification protein [Pseudomonas fluorescens]
MIPALLLREDGLVKTQRFNNSKYVGDPINAIRIFNEKEVDEIVVIDIDATRLKRPPNYTLIEEFAAECFMPLGYGGGINTVEQAKNLFSLGVEKIILQSAAFDNPKFITELASRFGSQSIVISIDVKRDWLGRIRLWSSSSRRKISADWLAVMKELASAGAGEILLNSVDRDGMQNGYDLDVIKSAASVLDIPLVALGGAGKMEHLLEAVQAGASAVAAGSLFVLQGPHRAVLISYPGYSALESLFRSSDVS